MLTYSFDDRGNEPLYEYLYNQIKKDITSFKLSADEKLPSKRALAKNLNISIITVENAYSQLIAEGYIYSVPKSGFYVCDISSAKPMSEEKPKRVIKTATDKKKYIADFVNNSMSKDSFPFTGAFPCTCSVISSSTISAFSVSASSTVFSSVTESFELFL